MCSWASLVRRSSSTGGSPRTSRQQARTARSRRKPGRLPSWTGAHDGGHGDGDSRVHAAGAGPGEPVDERADVYSLGAILYHLLAGDPPYRGPSSEQALREVLTGPPQPLALREKTFPGSARPRLQGHGARSARALPDGQELAEDLRRFQTGQIIGAHQYTRWELIRRFVRRYRAVLTIATAALLVLAGVGAVSVWQILAARDRAERNELAALSRADALSLMQARTDLEQDPNTIGALRSLSPGFTRWPEVRLLAAEAKARGLAVLLRGHTQGISELRFTQDGQVLVTSSDDRTLRVWDLEQGQSRVLEGHTDEVWGFALSPGSRQVASAGKDGTIRLWDLATGRSRILHGHSLPVAAVAFLPDGQRLLSAGQDGTIRIWDLGTGATVRVWRVEQAVYERLATDPAMQWAALTAFNEPVVRLWNLERGELRVLAGHSAHVTQAVFSPRGDLLATGGDDRTVRVWDPRTGQGRILGEHLGPLTALAVSPDGRTVAAASTEPVIRLWDVATGQLRELQGHQGRVGALAFSPDGRFLASSGYDRSVRLWELSTGKGQSIGGAGGNLLHLEFSPDGRRLAGAGLDGIVRVYATTSGGRVLQVPDVFSYSGLELSSDGRWLVTGGLKGEARLWELSTDTARVLSGHQGKTVVTVSRDGRWIASGGEEGRVRLWDTGGNLLRVLEGHPRDVTALAFSPDGRSLASASWTGEVRLWDWDSGRARVLSDEDPEQFITFGLVFSPDGRSMAAASEKGLAVRLWDLSTDERPLLLQTEGFIQTAALSPDGSRLLAGATDNTVRILGPARHPAPTPRHWWARGPAGALYTGWADDRDGRREREPCATLGCEDRTGPVGL